MDDKSRVLFALSTDIPDSHMAQVMVLFILSLLFRLFFFFLLQHSKFSWINDVDHV